MVHSLKFSAFLQVVIFLLHTGYSIPIDDLLLNIRSSDYVFLLFLSAGIEGFQKFPKLVLQICLSHLHFTLHCSLYNRDDGRRWPDPSMLIVEVICAIWDMRMIPRFKVKIQVSCRLFSAGIRLTSSKSELQLQNWTGLKPNFGEGNVCEVDWFS